MSNSRPNDMVPLTVQAADEGTEIFLIDSNFNRLQSAVGKMNARVRPGIYKVRFRAGEAQVDRIVEVTDEARGGRNSVEVSEAPLSFSSAAPIPGTRTTQEAHEVAWRRAWQCSDVNRGQGGRLFLMVRDPRPSSQVRLPRHPWAGIALSDACGKVLCDMSKNGWRDGHDGVATMHVELDPGVYVLRVDTSVAGVRKMAVAVCPGWQTQVLLATGQYRRSGKDRPSIVRRALLSDAAVFMVKPDATGDPWQFMEKQLRLTELARQGLAQGRAPIRPSDLQDMLWAKYENPMLGIIGAHLLLRTPEPDLNMLHTVVGNLERIVSGHPDVLALRLAVDTRRNVVVTEAPVCAVPPMLSASWQIIVEQSIKWPHLVPPGSLADRIGYGNLSGTPWLVWRRERLPAKANNNDGGKRWIQPPSAMRTRCSVPGRETGGEILSYLTSTYLSPLPLRQSQADSHQKTLPQLLADVHERFPTNISKSGADLYPSLPPAQRYLLQEVAIQSASGKSADPDQVVRRLGVPVTTVIGMAKDLLRRGGHPGNAVGRMG